MGKIAERLKNGIITENPTFVQMLGMCPTLAVTSSAINGLGMGLTTMVILTMSNFMISLLRKLIPDKVRIPAYIVIIASFVTIVQFLLQAYIPSLNDSLGIFIPLIVVNCIILGRAESYASKNPVIPSIFDGIGMGLGFTVGLTTIGIIREILGSGSIFGFGFVKAVENFAEGHASEKVFQILSDQGLFQPASILYRHQVHSLYWHLSLHLSTVVISRRQRRLAGRQRHADWQIVQAVRMPCVQAKERRSRI